MLTIHTLQLTTDCINYCETSSISHTKSQNLNVSCFPLQLFSLNPLKPGVKLRMIKIKYAQLVTVYL